MTKQTQEYKGNVYFKGYREAVNHLEKHCPTGRIVSYDRGYAVQTRASGPYLNMKGEVN